jgi:CRISPR/Cas system endoribonuclease Cas6 (RAMP superfamily)
MTPKRIGLLVDPDTVRLELVERATIPSTLNLAGRTGRLGNMRGWVGHVIVDCNAPAHWLLEVAARIGFGGTTSFGFGRIKVSEV